MKENELTWQDIELISNILEAQTDAEIQCIEGWDQPMTEEEWYQRALNKFKQIKNNHEVE